MGQKIRLLAQGGVTMKRSIKVCAMAVGTLGAAMCSLAVAMSGCSSSSTSVTPGTDSGTPKGDTGAKTDAPAAMACSIYDLPVIFAPMYSAVIPGSNTHTFQIPAIVSGVAGADVTWSASSNVVSLAEDASFGGIMITMLDTGNGGPVTIQAQLTGSNVCGKSTLNITSTTNEAWSTGNTRYNTGPTMPTFGPGAPRGPRPGAACENTDDAGNLYTYACINCHGDNGNDSGLGMGFNDVSHTPEQAGGFSDDQLIAIFRNGEVPGWPNDAGTTGEGPGAAPWTPAGYPNEMDAGYFDISIIPYGGFAWWHCMHQWGVTDAEAVGIVTYLRSLTPKAQAGTSGFGGHGPPGDGGFHRPDGGYHFGDGGGYGHHDGGHAPTGDTGAGSTDAVAHKHPG
jgi:hypothetical protein